MITKFGIIAVISSMVYAQHRLPLLTVPGNGRGQGAPIQDINGIFDGDRTGNQGILPFSQGSGFRAPGDQFQAEFRADTQFPDLAQLPQLVQEHTPRQRLEDVIAGAWEEFKVRYNKAYRSIEEDILRREIFVENTNRIVRFNEDYALGKTTFVQQLNPYADMLPHEFSNALNGFNRTSGNGEAEINTAKASAFIPSANVQIPESIDWRELGAVTAVKSQGLCGACYAFSASGALEGHWFRKTGVLMELSPQNLIDCTKPYGNDGCMGGLMDPAFQYVKDNAGIDMENAYPYEQNDQQQCRYQQEGYGADDTGFVDIPEGDENSLKIAVATLGPVSAAVDASRDSLQFYSDGVYFDEKCKNMTEDMNHAVLVVGYGVESDGREYWIVKNSYGAEWGNGGYMKLARNKGNHCGIASIASYPLV